VKASACSLGADESEVSSEIGAAPRSGPLAARLATGNAPGRETPGRQHRFQDPKVTAGANSPSLLEPGRRAESALHRGV
jgi:hypothetical protein